MVEIKNGLLLVKTTLKESSLEALKKFLVHGFEVLFSFVAIALIVLLTWLVVVIKMYEVAILWLFVVVILSLVTIGTIHHIGRKKYNKLYEKTKPPFSTDKLIKAEVQHNPTGKVGIEGNPPHLIFDIRVVNGTNYSFKTKEVFLKCNCYYPKNLVCSEKWKDEAKSQHIYPTELQSSKDGNIQFQVPKEKIDDSKRMFTLGGYVEYTTGDGIIHEDLCKTVKVNITKLEYTLDEETAPEPKGRVIIAK